MMKKSIINVKFFAFLSCLIMVLYLFFLPTRQFSTALAFSENEIISNADDDYTMAPGTLKMLNGETKGEQRGFSEVNDSEAVDGKAFRFEIPKSGTYLSNTIVFDSPAEISDGIVLRIYVHLSDSGLYSSVEGGIRFYGKGADGHSPGYLLSENIKQNQWISIYLTRSEALEIADDDGKVYGIMIGAGFKNPDEITQPYVLIDYFAVPLMRQVSFESEGETIETINLRNGMTADVSRISPTREGYVFCGWAAEDGRLYDFNDPILENLTLTAKWGKREENIPAGLYRGVDGDIFVFEDGTAQIPEGSIEGKPVAFGYIEEKLLVVQTDSGVGAYMFDLSNDYEKIPAYLIVFQTGTLSGDIKTYIEDKKKVDEPDSVERPGYRLDGWIQEDGTKFDFDTEITKSYVLTAAWSYDEIDSYGEHLGFYYDGTSETMVELKADNNASYGGNDLKYYILSSYEIVFDGAEEDMVGTAYYNRLFVGGSDFIRLQNCEVEFYLDDEAGSRPISRQRVSAETDWKVTTALEDPEAEPGWKFCGWYTADGIEFDFNDVIVGGQNVYARFERVEGEITETNGSQAPESGGTKKGLLIGSIAGGSCLIAAAGVTVFYLVKRKKAGKK